jgi:hypothetical protein
VSERSIEDPPRRDAVTRLQEDVAARLRNVCTEMPADEFEALVREIVRVKVKYDPPPNARR